MSKVDQQGMPILKEGEYRFRDDHPGRRYCCIKKANKIKVPKISMPKGMICDLEDLQLSDETPSEEALQNRENYAKVALILFYPFWDNSNFSVEQDGCLWGKMTRLMTTEIPQHHFFRGEKKYSKICKTTSKQGNAKFRWNH